jgi:hypothetical protein
MDRKASWKRNKSKSEQVDDSDSILIAANAAIPIYNFDLIPPSQWSVPLLPNITHALLIGTASSSGKSNVLINLLLYKLPNKHIYICRRTIDQPK